MIGKIKLFLSDKFMWSFKRYLALPLFFVYFLAVTGVVIQSTCCIDESSMTTAAQPLSDCCHPVPPQKHNSTVSDKNHCCHHPTVIVKTIHHQMVDRADFSIFHQLQQAVAGSFFNFGDAALHDDLRHEANFSNAPPGFWQNIPLYKLHQRFTFYG